MQNLVITLPGDSFTDHRVMSVGKGHRCLHSGVIKPKRYLKRKIEGGEEGGGSERKTHSPPHSSGPQRGTRYTPSAVQGTAWSGVEVRIVSRNESTLFAAAHSSDNIFRKKQQHIGTPSLFTTRCTAPSTTLSFIACLTPSHLA